MAKTEQRAEIIVSELTRESISLVVVGTTGLYCHRMSAKAKRTLMIGGRRKTQAERLELKHQPMKEYRDSLHVQKDFNEHTHVVFPVMAFKSAMATAALAIPGIKKTDVNRLVFLPDEVVPIYGVPQVRMDIVRSADIAKTPDVRTRAYFPEWASKITIHYLRPQFSQQSIATLLHNAGMLCGVGDFRQEKGKGSYGTFVVADEIPEHLLDAAAQWDAIEHPQAANLETAELLAEFDAEVEARR